MWGFHTMVCPHRFKWSIKTKSKTISTNLLGDRVPWVHLFPKTSYEKLNVRADQIFFGQKLQTSQLSLGQNMIGHQFWAPSRQILPHPGSSKIGNSSPTSLKMVQFGSSWGYTQMVPKNDVHPCFLSPLWSF